MKATQRWILFKYVSGKLTPLSKSFKSRQAAVRARAKLPEREQRTIAIGLMRTKH